MSTTYATIGQALYDLFSGLDITAIYPGGWALKANYPVKEPGQLTTWPVFSVVPVEDNEISLENTGNDDTLTYAVFLYDTFEDAATSENTLRRLVDLCRTRLRQEWDSATPLGGGAYAIVALSGAWGYDPDLGLRYYRFQMQTRTYESTL